MYSIPLCVQRVRETCGVIIVGGRYDFMKLNRTDVTIRKMFHSLSFSLPRAADMPVLITSSSSIKMLKLKGIQKKDCTSRSMMKLVKTNVAFNGKNVNKLTETVGSPS